MALLYLGGVPLMSCEPTRRSMPKCIAKGNAADAYWKDIKVYLTDGNREQAKSYWSYCQSNPQLKMDQIQLQEYNMKCRNYVAWIVLYLYCPWIWWYNEDDEEMYSAGPPRSGTWGKLWLEKEDDWYYFKLRDIIREMEDADMDIEDDLRNGYEWLLEYERCSRYESSNPYNKMFYQDDNGEYRQVIDEQQFIEDIHLFLPEGSIIDEVDLCLQVITIHIERYATRHIQDLA